MTYLEMVSELDVLQIKYPEGVISQKGLNSAYSAADRGCHRGSYGISVNDCAHRKSFCRADRQ
jgi:hypothetical protein